ncbi:transcriptional regulator [Riemerella columbipharyngis]|uniref:Bacteriophage CI repressor helix-turn-helix domain-containing protein n=1 Tax=Riemerella columbipharyngis TaxID=1071918 RepID=A0A1G6ZDQ5_9FLAO|nr:transcriptional regulator [Riemerella columbipharyngis]SDE00769.1 hypothetical protein SAMN05421544_10250 [Riemerella columbipharyngis]
MERNLTNIKERILYYTDIKGFSKEKFFEELQITYGNFKGKAKNQALSSDVIERIIAKYDDLNPVWLLTGKGEMLKEVKIDNSNSKADNSFLGNNITGNNVTISNNDISNIIEMHKDLAESLKMSQNQINTLLEILKNR